MMVYDPIRLRASAPTPRYPALATIANPRFATIASSLDDRAPGFDASGQAWAIQASLLRPMAGGNLEIGAKYINASSKTMGRTEDVIIGVGLKLPWPGESGLPK